MDLWEYWAEWVDVQRGTRVGGACQNGPWSHPRRDKKSCDGACPPDETESNRKPHWRDHGLSKNSISRWRNSGNKDKRWVVRVLFNSANIKKNATLLLLTKRNMAAIKETKKTKANLVPVSIIFNFCPNCFSVKCENDVFLDPETRNSILYDFWPYSPFSTLVEAVCAGYPPPNATKSPLSCLNLVVHQINALTIYRCG